MEARLLGFWEKLLTKWRKEKKSLGDMMMGMALELGESNYLGWDKLED